MVRLPAKHILTSQNGLSLIESLIAVAMLSMFIGLSATYTNLFKPAPSSLRRACMAHAQSVINTVQEQTYYRQIMNFIPHEGGVGDNGNRHTTFLATSGYADRAVPNSSDYWSGANQDFNISMYPYGSANFIKKGPALQNSQLIQGSMRALSAIWNTNQAVRCAFGQYEPLTNLPLSPEMRRLSPSPTTRLKIRPYSRLQGTDLCGQYANGGLNIYPAPEPNQIWDGSVMGRGSLLVNNEKFASASSGGAQPAGTGGEKFPPGGVAYFQRGNTTTAMGLEMTVETTYVPDPLNSPGVTDTCTVSQNFEYPADTTAPLPPDVVRIKTGSNPTMPGATVNNCRTNAAPNVSVEIGFQNTTMEQGTQLFCHDLSWWKVWNLSATAPYTGSGIACVTGPGGVDPAIAGKPNSEVRSSQRFSNARDHWVPCDQLVQCSKAPATVNYHVSGGPGPTNLTLASQNVLYGTAPDNLFRVPGNAQDTAPPLTSAAHILTLNYTGLPYGCVLNFEAVAIDTAGNVSALVPITPPATTRRFLDMNPGTTYDNPSDIHSEIHRNTCENPVGSALCSAATLQDFDSVTFPVGYYTCALGGCCVGVGCTSTSGSFP